MALTSVGPADARGHGALRDEEGARDLGRGQAADGAERERGLGGRGQRRMAAQEQQDQGVVGVRTAGVLPACVGHVGGGELAGPSRAVAADLVDEPPGGRGDQPAARAVGHAAGGPGRGGGDDRLLHGVLALLELPVPADEHAEDLRRQLAQQVLGGGVGPHISRSPAENMTGRTSMAMPSTLASGIIAASSMARSRLSQSIR